MPAVVTERTGARILMTADAVGGVWQYAIDLAQGLRSHGVEITLAVLGPAPSSDQQGQAEAAGVELILTGLPLDWTARTVNELEEAGRVLARVADKIQPDLIHLNSPALAASASFKCPVVAVCHSCVATWWKAVRQGPLPEEFVWRTEMVARGYRAADMLLAPTEAFARATARTYGLKSLPIVVRNGRGAPSVKDDTSLEPFAFTAGRLWDEGKNFAALDRVASRLSVSVLAAGPLQGPNGARIEAGHARSLGRLTDAEIARYLSSRPIFVSTARYEPFGLAVLEAAQAGCPLVLSDIPTFRELWDGAALFVAPDDEDATAAAIEGLARDADERRRLGSAAHKAAAAYSVEAMSAGVFTVYRTLLASKPQKTSLKGAAA